MITIRDALRGDGADVNENMRLAEAVCKLYGFPELTGEWAKKTYGVPLSMDLVYEHVTGWRRTLDVKLLPIGNVRRLSGSWLFTVNLDSNPIVAAYKSIAAAKDLPTVGAFRTDGVRGFMGIAVFPKNDSVSWERAMRAGVCVRQYRHHTYMLSTLVGAISVLDNTVYEESPECNPGEYA